jgi:hypothetical protein
LLDQDNREEKMSMTYKLLLLFFLAFRSFYAGASDGRDVSDDSSPKTLTAFSVANHFEGGSFDATSPGYPADRYKLRNIGALSFLILSPEQYLIFDVSAITSSLIYEAFQTKNFGGHALQSDRMMFYTTHARILLASKIASLGASEKTGLQMGFDAHWYRFGLQMGSELPSVFTTNVGTGSTPIFNNGVAQSRAKLSLGLNLHTVSDVGFGLLRCSFLPSYMLKKGYNLNTEVSLCFTGIFINPFITAGYRFTHLSGKKAEPYNHPATNFNSFYISTGINIGI